MNALAAAAVGEALGLSIDEIQMGAVQCKPSQNRMDIIKKDGMTIINDVYNANPDSVKAALQVLAAVPKGTVAILGDMLELGAQAGEMHYKIGCLAASLGIERIICVGPLSRRTYQGALDNRKSGTHAEYAAGKEEFLAGPSFSFFRGDTILVKASRGMEFEKIVEKLIV